MFLKVNANEKSTILKKNNLLLKRLTILFLFVLFINDSFAQNRVYAYKVVDTLCSKTMFGRCCNKKGDSLAAEFIANEFKKHNLLSFTPNYKQAYTLKCNEIKQINCALYHPDSVLQAGEDYVVFGNSPSTNLVVENEKPVYFNTLADWEKYSKKEKLTGKILVFDAKAISYGILVRNILNDISETEVLPKLIVLHNHNSKLMFPSGRNQAKFPVLLLKGQVSKKKKIDYLQLFIKSEYYPEYNTQNVTAYVKGKLQPDTFFVLTAHYDHLGGMGNDVYFPGANDNASSVACLLDLASYYAKPENQPDYSILFISTSGEELGLLGAEYYASHSDIPLSSIKFLLNLDMNGTGSGGFHLVHGLVEKKASSLIEKINTKNRYFTKVINGGEAANSDHYPFYKRSVPCLFVFTSGCEYNEYHSIYDKPQDLPFTKYESIFKLITGFIKEYR